MTFQVNPGLGAYAHTDRFRMADWGTLFFSDAAGVFAVSNVISGFSGHIVVPDGLGSYTVDSLSLTNTYLGFEEASFSFRITNGLTITPGAGLIGRYATTLSCTDLTNAGLVKFGSNSTVIVGGNIRMTNAELTLRYGSSLTVSGAWEVAGAAAIASLQGVDAGVTGPIRFASGAVLHVFGAPTNGTPGAWGGRIRTPANLTLETGAWIFPFSDTTNGGSPLFQCLNFLVDSGCGVNADGGGYAQDKGPAPGATAAVDPGGGGGHGGRGGDSSSGRLGGNAYGNAIQPIQAGSGGGRTTSTYGGAGGGVIRIEAENLILVNGSLTANGTAGGSFAARDGGGGAGGAIFLSGAALAGTNGLIQANGGKAYYSATWAGAGAGGRIAVRYNAAAQASIPRPTIRFTANPGDGFPWARQWLTADWGTLCFPDASLIFAPSETLSGFGGHITITNGLFTAFTANSLTLSDAWLGFESPGFAFQIAGPITLQTNGGIISRVPFSLSCTAYTNLGVTRTASNAAFSVGSTFLNSNALFSMRGGSTLGVGGNLENGGGAGQLALEGVDVAIAGNLAARTGSLISVFGIATNGSPWDWGARMAVGGDIRIETNAWIHPYADPINGGAPLFQCLSLSVAENAGINADAKGFAQNRGPNPGISGNPAGGGGHGGKGGNSSSGRAGGAVNDKTLFPLLPGSGGGNGTSGIGGTGGGTIRVEAQNVLTLNGTLTANGGAGSAASAAGRDNGGGAGGSIFVIANAFSGGTQAVMSARGAAATTSSGGTIGAGGGGGGRIAIWTRATTDAVAAAESSTNRLVIGSTLSSFSGTASIDGGTGWQAGTNGILFFITFQTKGTLILVR